MALFAVTLTDQTTDVVEGADAYQLEGPLTTFFAFRSNRNVIDSWSVRLASYRTADIAGPGDAKVSTSGMGDAVLNELERSLA